MGFFSSSAKSSNDNSSSSSDTLKQLAEKPQQHHTNIISNQQQQQQQNSSSDSAELPSRTEMLIQNAIHPMIRQEYMSAAYVETSAQMLRLITNQCMRHCQVYQPNASNNTKSDKLRSYFQVTQSGKYNDDHLSHEQEECIRHCGKKMIQVMREVSETYSDRLSNPGATTYLGLNENLASSFRNNA